MIQQPKQRNLQKLVVLTRQPKDNHKLHNILTNAGFTVYELPCIKTIQNQISPQTYSVVTKNKFDRIIFTSGNCVTYFVNQFKYLLNIPAATVGEKTALIAKKKGFTVGIVANGSGRDALVEILRDVSGENILIPCSNLAPRTYIADLEKKGAKVFPIVVYNTEYITNTDPVFETYVSQKRIGCLIFMSTSAVVGCLKRTSPSLHQELIRVPVCSLGMETTGTLQRFGFQQIYTAPKNSIESLTNIVVTIMEKLTYEC